MKRIILLIIPLLILGCAEEEPITPNQIVSPKNETDSRGCTILDEYQAVEYIRSFWLPPGPNEYQYTFKYKWPKFSIQPKAVPPSADIDIVKNGLLIGRVDQLNHPGCADIFQDEIYSMSSVPFHGNDFRLMVNGQIPSHASSNNYFDINSGTIFTELIDLKAREKNIGSYVPVNSITFKAGKSFEFSAVSKKYNDDDYFNYEVSVEFPEITVANENLFNYRTDGADLKTTSYSEKAMPYPLWLSEYEIIIKVKLNGTVFQTYSQMIDVVWD